MIPSRCSFPHTAMSSEPPAPLSPSASAAVPSATSTSPGCLTVNCKGTSSSRSPTIFYAYTVATMCSFVAAVVAGFLVWRILYRNRNRERSGIGRRALRVSERKEAPIIFDAHLDLEKAHKFQQTKIVALSMNYAYEGKEQHTHRAMEWPRDPDSTLSRLSESELDDRDVRVCAVVLVAMPLHSQTEGIRGLELGSYQSVLHTNSQSTL
ncbi:hypothetical protein HMN09_00257800 [Mycena chlorophos]|uniref:Uncharacterized protein n=1 Tax=Mycena chlorophos TaxID=658473 RepID=A0A8H6TP32_MYCCL|nr:hypothetical protein HMN09_00257800 [Mycena chlorophos]